MASEDFKHIFLHKTKRESTRSLSAEAHQLARDLILYRLGKASDCSSITAENIRRLSDELEAQHGVFLDSMCHRLEVTPESAHSKFVQVADEVFREGINWGRIVALFTFGGRLAQNLQQNGNENVDEIAEWLGDYITNLSDWIQEHGGWEGFNKQYQDPSRPVRIWWSRVVLTTIGLGALATMIYQHNYLP